MSSRTFRLTPEILLHAYANGIFPMADSATSRELHWFDPPIRAVIPLDDTFHVPRRLARTIRQQPFTIKLNGDFPQVMAMCAAPALARETTWINSEITKLYTELHRRGHAHSIEAWEGTALVGGLYGVSLGGAFFGESMFSRARDASKIALVHLVALLRVSGFSLLDTQFQTEHLSQFGTYETTRATYHLMLEMALSQKTHLRTLTNEEWHRSVLADGGLESAR